MSLKHGAGEEFLFVLLPRQQDLHIAEPAQRFDKIIRALIPANGLQAVGHALRRLHKQGSPTGSVELGGSEIRETRGLESMALPDLEWDFKQQVVMFVKRRKVDSHD